MALKLVEEVLSETDLLGHPIPLKLLSNEIKSGEDYRPRVKELVTDAILGVVILDGLRPNVTYEFGLLEGANQPTLLLATSEATIAIRSLFPRDTKGNLLGTGLSPQNLRLLADPTLELNRQLSDRAGTHVVYVPSSTKDPKGFKEKVRESLARMRESIVTSPRLDGEIQKLEQQGATAFDSGDFETVLKVSSELLGFNQNSIPWQLNRANSLSQLGRAPEALTIIDQIIERHPKSTMAWIDKGVVLLSSDDPHGAKECFTRALEINPKIGVAWMNRAAARAEDGDLVGAMADANHALKENPEDARAWITKAYVDLQQGKPAEALKCADKAIEINPRETRGWIAKSRALSDLDRAKKSLEAIESGVRLARVPRDLYDLYWTKALLLSTMHDDEQEIEALTKCLELRPNSHHTLFHLGIARANLKQHDLAIKAFDEARVLGEPPGRCFSRIASIYSTNGDFEQAKNFFEQATAADKNLDDAWNNLASNCLLLNDPGGALAAALKAVALDPRKAEYQCTKAFALGLLGGGPVQAELLAELCKNDLKQTPSAWYRLATLHQIQGNLTSVQAALDRGKQHDTDGRTLNRYATLFALHGVNDKSVTTKRKSKPRL